VLRPPTDLATEHEGRGDVEVRQVALEQFVCAAIDIADADDVIAVAAIGKDGRPLGRHARTELQRRLAAFQKRELALDGADGGIQTLARIEIALGSALHRLERPFGRCTMCRYVGRAEKLTTRAMRHVEFEHA